MGKEVWFGDGILGEELDVCRGGVQGEGKGEFFVGCLVSPGFLVKEILGVGSIFFRFKVCVNGKNMVS